MADKKAIVVDDDTSFLALCALFLETDGFEVLEFSDPFRALDFLSKAKEHFCLLITDFNMPGMTGAELVKAIKETHPSIRSICLTGMSGSENVCLEAGCDCFLLKPISFQELRKEVKSVLSA